MNLKQLEAFVEVAEGGSFSKAAKNLYLTRDDQCAYLCSLRKNWKYGCLSEIQKKSVCRQKVRHCIVSQSDGRSGETD